VVAHLALELARGLEEVHAQGLVHRDLKPSNVLLGRSGEVKIADFGIVLPLAGPALTATGHAMGTPPYMSPEQLLGERVDARSDLFSLGVMLYELLAGAVPFEVGDPETGDALLRRIQGRRYARLRGAGPRWLSRLCDRLLQPRPRRRPVSATEVRRLLEERLGCPTPAECREAIADWIAQARILDPGAQETRPARGAEPAPSRPGALPLALAATLLLALVASSCVLIGDPASFPTLEHLLARALGAIGLP
jgi:serine/threonine protein kinase